MEGTEQFQATIQNYLENLAATDKLFAITYAKPHKNIEECVSYILNEVKKSGCNGFTDEEIFSLAIHYYDEDDLKGYSPIKCKVVVNHHVELTDEEKQQAREQALKRAENEAYAALKRRREKKRQEEENNPSQQLTLF